MNKKVVIAAVVALIVVTGAVAAYIFTQNAASPSKTSSDSADIQSAVATITYTANGFAPETVTVKSGDTVAIKNTSNEELEFESAPHPVHTDNTELNVGLVASGQTLAFKVTTKGEYGIHNHRNAGHTATIIVQ